MWRILAVFLLVVAGCTRQPAIIEPEEIDICPVLADQIEILLGTITEFVASATIAELESPAGTVAELRQRGEDLSRRALDLGCDPQELRRAISTDRLSSDDPIAQRYISLVVESLSQS